MQYTLMHKNIAVADMELDEATSSIQRIDAVYRPEHLPVATASKRDGVDRAALNAWWIDRCIPASRSGVRKALETLELPNTQVLLTRCFGLSLSDQYWVRPHGSDLRWERINFFENPFSKDIGDVLLGKATDTTNFDLNSPDNTTNGYLKKRWKIIDGKRCLLKAGSNPFMQQPFNEVIASLVAEKLGISHVPYTLLWDDDTPYSVCEDFVTPDTELVSAWRVMQSMRKDNNTSVYRHYLNCCEALGIAGVRDALDRMLVVDYLLVNEDRHQNNFGVIRNANTLVWEGAAPIYDSGTSLWFDTPTPMIRAEAPRVTSKPFKTSHEEQIKLVSSFDWIDWDALTDLDELFQSVTEGSMFVDDARRTAIGAALRKRVQMLKEHTAAGKAFTQGADISGDVQTDVAYSGKTE